jgi:3-oxoacyl-[acyl-carrier protein] reductase
MEPHEARYQDRVVVVTGARKGLGRMLADHFLEEGARVIGMSRGEAAIAHPNYDHRNVDVGNDLEVKSAFAGIARSHGGRVDIVVNNAGVLASVRAMLMPAPRAEEMVRTNFLGSFYVSCEAAKLMRRGKFGRIINIGSMASVLEPVGDSIYAATKAASMTLMGVLAKEFASYGITVNTLAVSTFQTDMLEQIPADAMAAVLAELPIPRMATPDDVLNVVDFFASPSSSLITAQTLFLGGAHA